MVEVDLNSPLDPAVSLEDLEPASRVLVDQNHSNIHPHLDHLKSNQIKSNQIKSNQIKSNQVFKMFLQGFPQRLRLLETTVRSLYCLFPNIHESLKL